LRFLPTGRGGFRSEIKSIKDIKGIKERLAGKRKQQAVE
jgi:TRAP-type mannitol/chloroaromatic compound transport system substrate-binding protein